MKGETLLHLAVLNDDLETIRKLRHDPSACEMKNGLGFTALEIAKLLDKRQVVHLLEPHPEFDIKVQQKHETKPKKITQQEFEQLFDIHYLPQLKFASYDELKLVIANCPWTVGTSSLGEENRQLGARYSKEIFGGYLVDITIQWIDDIFEYGAFAAQDIPAESFIGEYTGLVRRLYRLHPDHNGYCFHYPTRFWSWKYYMVDGLKEGNLLRFVNHSDTPNMEPICLSDRGILHLAFQAKEHIKKGTQLTFDYGTDYWRRRQKFET